MTVTDYNQFIQSKQLLPVLSGFNADDAWMPDALFPFQRDCVKWALRRGRSALFLDTGLGKTITQLTWAQNVVNHTGGMVIVIAPLCVAHQTVREGEKFGIDVQYLRHHADDMSGIVITNYEMINNFHLDQFAGVVLDESSILKGMTGKYRKMLTESCALIPYRLSCTATPSPNDFMELGTQSEWLGLMSQVEMLAMFFIHDGSDTSKWRLKGHGKSRFWEWLASWSIVLKKPSDLGYSDEGYNLPAIKYHQHVIDTAPTDGLFVEVAQGLQERNKARRESLFDRVLMASEIANNIDPSEPVIVWCQLNDESSMLEDRIHDALQVAGSMKPEVKEQRLIDFTTGDLRILVSKPSIAGFGMNWQHCANVIFVGLSDSWEKYYQAIRRCYRFGQTRNVNVHIISADTEGAVVANIKRKESQNSEMSVSMVDHMRTFTMDSIQSATAEKTDYLADVPATMPAFI